jgi:hypothetical protein
MIDPRITDRAPYGGHILLVCVNHPDLNWSTKNIGASTSDGRVGLMRSIFFASSGCECDCPASLLRLHPMYSEQEAVHE